jgi:hypothetical protein
VFLGHSVAQSNNMSEETARLIDEEVRRLIEYGETEARKIITENRDAFIEIAEGLLEYETLTGDELRGMLEGKKPARDLGDDTPSSRGSAVPNAGSTGGRRRVRRRNGAAAAGLRFPIRDRSTIRMPAASLLAFFVCIQGSSLCQPCLATSCLGRSNTYSYNVMLASCDFMAKQAP